MDDAQERFCRRCKQRVKMMEGSTRIVACPRAKSDTERSYFGAMLRFGCELGKGKDDESVDR